MVDVDSMAEMKVTLFAIGHTYPVGQSLDVIEDIRLVNGLRGVGRAGHEATLNRGADERCVDLTQVSSWSRQAAMHEHAYEGSWRLRGRQAAVWDTIVDGLFCARLPEDAKGKRASRSSSIKQGNMSYPRPFTLMHRINPERNERRFYAVQVGPSLFDEHAVLRLWGRIGGYQRQMVTPCQSPDDAQALARQLIQRRLQHGYQILKGGEPLD